jgi:hypothetical protein
MLNIKGKSKGQKKNDKVYISTLITRKYCKNMKNSNSHGKQEVDVQ